MGKYALLQPGQHPPRAAEFPVLSILDLSDAQLGQLCEPEGGVLVLDLETQGTQVWDCTRLVVMFSVADASGSMAVHIGTSRAGQERWRKLLGMLAHKRTPLLAHNVAFDACWLSRDLTLALAPVAPGVPVDAEFWDTGIHWHNWFGCTLAMAKHFASESFIGQSHGLKHLQKDLLGWPESNEKELDEWLCNNGWGEWVNKKLPDGGKVPSPKPNKAEMWRAPAEVLGRYAALDSESTWLLWDKVLRPVWDTFGAYREMHQDWMHGPDGNQRHLAWQKLRGVAIDTGRAAALRAALEARLAELEDEFRAHPDVAAHIQAMEAEVVQEIANREPSRWKKLPGDGGGVPPQYTKSGAVSKAWLSWQEKQARARQLREDITASEARDDGQPVGTAAEFQSSHWTGWRVKHEEAKAARHFNLRSAEQKRQLFYDRMGLEVLVWTEPDNPNSEPQPGTDEEAMKGWGEAGKLLMTYATVEKLRSTIESLQEKLDSAGRYHPELRVPGTQTGRLSGSGGFNWQNCFPGYTEVLTKNGWVRLDQLEKGVEVFTANTDLTGQFAAPTGYIQQPYSGMLTVWGKGDNESVEMTPDHNLLLFPEYRSKQDPSFWVQSAGARLPKNQVLIARVATESSHSEESEEELWKVFALQADGSMRKDRPGVFTAGFKKSRKIEKMRELFGPETNTYNGVTAWAYIKFQHRRLNADKTLNLNGLGTQWKDVVLSCAKFWDGNAVKNGGFEYVSTIEANVDALQAYLTRCGVTTKKAKYARNWRLYVSENRQFKTLRETQRSERHFTGDVYCVSVPSGFLVIRQKGATWVVGNCAKRKEFLEIFRAPLGKVLMFADIAALEPATLAQRSQDPTYLMVYGPEAKPTDIYLQVAANLGGELGGKIRATGFDPSNPTAEAVAKAKKEAKKERNIAKLLHLSANYGAGAGKIRLGLAEQGIEVSLAEARRLHTAYWKLFAQVKNYEKWLRAQWENNGGWWLNPIGRPVCADERKLKDLCNVDCQSGGHDIFLLFTKVLAEELSARGVVYQPWNYDIHDCTALEIDKEDVEVVREVVDKVVPDKVNAILGGVVRLKWEANFVECWAEDKTESPSIAELGVKL